MKALTSIPTPNGPDGLVQGLIGTLRKEQDTLTRLAIQFGCQLDALREQRPDRHEHAMQEVSEILCVLGQLRAQRERQIRLLSRVLRIDDGEPTLQRLAASIDSHPDTGPWGPELLEARAGVREQAKAARRVCEQLDFALQYAVGLGREMLQAIQDLDRPPPCVYTAQGHTSRAVSPRSLLNKVG